MDRLFTRGQTGLIVTIGILMLCTSVPAIAQRSFRITTRDGLNTNTTTQLLRDRHNHMWIGSYNGLHKHEGNSILLYNRTGIDGYSMSSGEIYTLYEDDEGQIWAGSAAGLDRIDPVTGRITNFHLQLPDKSSSFIGYVYAVFQDRERNIWASTDAAVFKLNPATGTYVQIPKARDSTGIPTPVAGYVTGVGDDRGFWMQVATGLVYYAYRSGHFFHRYHNPQRNPVFDFDQPAIGANGGLCLDTMQNLYFVAGHRNLVRYHTRTQAIDTFPIPFPAGAWQCCVSLALDHKGNAWIGTRKGGVLVYHFKEKTWTAIQSEHPASLISNNYVHSLCEDYRGNMWVATDNGVNVIDLYDSSLHILPLNPNDDIVKQEHETGIISLADGNRVAVPFSYSGITLHDLTSHVLSHYAKPEHLSRILYLHDAGNGNYWVSDERSLSRALFDQNVLMRTVPLDAPFVPMLKAYPGYVAWMHKTREGTYVFKKSNGSLYLYAGGDTLSVIRSHSFMKQACISADSSALWYILPNLNLGYRRFDDGSMAHYDLQRHLVEMKFSHSIPRDLIEDKQGNIWITSINGVLRYNYKHDTLTVFTQSEGLSHGFSFALALDAQDNLWVCNLGGIDLYDRERHTFSNVHGFQTGRYIDAFGSALMLQDGRIVFVSGNTLYTIDPGQRGNKELIPLNFRFEEIRVNDEVLNPGLNSTLQLRHSQNRLYVRFSVLDFERPGQIRFDYRLIGSDNEWISLGNQNTLALQEIQPGEYTLEVRVHESTRDLDADIIRLAFHITPPFYATWWFRVLTALSLIAGTFLLMQTRIREINRKNQIRQQLTDLEVKALRAQMNPHFIFNCLNAIQECVVTGRIDEAYTYLSKFSRLLRMVLEHSDHPVIMLSKELEILGLYISLEKLRFKEQFEFQLETADQLEIESTAIPAMLIQPHIENAIWHGLRHRDTHRVLSLRIAEEDSAYIRVTIRDNGIGRSASRELKETRLGSHTSKGMSICTQRIALLQQEYPLTMMQVTDLYDDTGTASGTQVEIVLPVVPKTL